MSDVVKAIELEKGLVRFNYNKRPEGRVGQVFQMRDAIRDEVCGLILKSKQVTLEDLNIHFLGNFGIVGQYSENLTYNRLNCTPERADLCRFCRFCSDVGMPGKSEYLGFPL